MDAAVSHRLVELAIEVEEQAASEEAPSGAAENCPQRAPVHGGVWSRRLPLPLKAGDAPGGGSVESLLSRPFAQCYS